MEPRKYREREDLIPRYTRPALGKIWTDENKFRIWLEIELLACEAQAELGNVPREAVQEIRKKATFDIRRIDEIEREVQHDVIAFLTNVGESVGPCSRYVHLGMTSSDVLDTALALQMKHSGELIREDLQQLTDVLGKRAVEFRGTPMVGRTHGVHAEPITFGLKLALWYEEIKRQAGRLKRAIEAIAVGPVSGAVGTFAHVYPFVGRYVWEKLGLQPDPISNQVLQRDRHAEFLNSLALIGCSLEKIRLRSAIFRKQKSTRQKNISRRVRRAPPRCRTSGIQSRANGSPAFPEFSGRTRSREWKA